MKTIKKIFGFIFLILIVLAALITYSGYEKYKKALDEKPLLYAQAEICGIENYTTLDEVPKLYLNAVIAAEDRRYYYHKGFDIIGTARAVITDIKTRSLAEGGSTISQQLAKNIYFLQDNSPTRKIAEIFMAVNMEKALSKNEILELYINTIYYGSGYYCIYDAAMGYFGKTPAQMNDYEATLLAGIPNAPSVYSPKVNPQLSAKRQEKIIDCLIDCDYITEEEGKKILEMAE